MIDNYLQKNGFIQVKLLDNDAINTLNGICDEIFNNTRSGFYSSSHFLDLTKSKEVNTILHQLILEKINTILPNIQLLGGTLATKKQNQDVLEIHQDWQIVDESQYNSYNIWMPLCDTNKTNGTLGLIPGSHKWNNYIRGFNIENPYSKFTKFLMQYSYEPNLQAGEAIIYNHKLLHFSRPNYSNIPRNVAIIGAKDKEANLIVSIGRDNYIDTYSTTEDDFYCFDSINIANKNHKVRNTQQEPINLKKKTIINWLSNNLSEDFPEISKKTTAFNSNIFHKLFS